MGSQFVDINRDGHLDYLTATFDGSPHVAFGNAKGFAEPVRLKDRNGKRVVISSYWDYEKKKHDKTGRALGVSEAPRERCISALAFDWDGDGDHDLLLGSYENGHLYRQMNEGTDEEPEYTGTCVPVMAGGTPFALPAKMTAPTLVDFDGDGDLDIVTGSFGNSYAAKGESGGVYLLRNTGQVGAPVFAAPETLIAPPERAGTEPNAPHAGLYPTVADVDGDGDLDLIVGGYSMWTPKGRELTDEEKATAERLAAELKDARAAYQALMQKMSAAVMDAMKGLEPRSPEAREKGSAVRESFKDRIAPAQKRMRDLYQKHRELVPGPQRKAFVWFYERLPAEKPASE